MENLITSEKISKNNDNDNVNQMNVIVQDAELKEKEDSYELIYYSNNNESEVKDEEEVKEEKENKQESIGELQDDLEENKYINEAEIDFEKPYLQQYYSESVPVVSDAGGGFSLYTYYQNHDYDIYRDPFKLGERSVSFNDIKQINYFFKDEIEMDPKSSNENSSVLDDDDEDDEYFNDYYGNKNNDEDDEEEEEEYEDEDYDDEEDSGEYDEDDDENKYSNKKIPYQKQRISNKLDISSDEVEEDENEEEDDSYNSVEEHSDVENKLDDSILQRYRVTTDSSEIEKNHLMSIRDSIDKTKLEKLQREFYSKTQTEEDDEDSLNVSNSEESNSSTNSTPNTGLKKWAQMGLKPIRFALSPNSSPNSSTIKLPIPQQIETEKSKDTEEEEEEEEEEEYNDDIIIHDDIENDKLTDIIAKAVNNSHNDLYEDEENDEEDDEKILEIIKSRSILEGNLIEIRNKVEQERQKLKEYFTNAKEDLKTSINNVSKYYESSGSSSTDGFDRHRNELEEVSKSLVELESKIVEIEDSIGKTKLKSNPKANKSQTKINSLLDEIVNLKEQIEKEKLEKINQDIELKDITNHLLEMASQLSDAIINNSPLNIGSSPSSLSSSGNNSSNNLMLYSPNNSSFVPSQYNNNHNNNNVNNNNINSMEKEIEFYREQIEKLEKRLSVWKHHNEMLHIELLNGKQINSQELSDLTYKIGKVEEERDKLSLKIDELVQNKGELEGREQILSNVINNLKTDNSLLFETIQVMQKDSEVIQERFDQLVTEIQEMGTTTVQKLQNIINDLILERGELQSSIRNAEIERFDLVKELNTITEKLISSENTNQQLLSSTSITMKSLESSEIKCQDLQSQLSLVTKRLNWADSEVDRLTKEMDRLIKTNSLEKEQLHKIQMEENEKIKLSFAFIRERAQDIKLVLSQEKNEIIQLGSDISFLLEKGKQNTSKTIKSLRDFVLKEVEVTKIDLNSRISEIESNILQNQDFSQVETNQRLLNEMTQQKYKLNEMQQKIIKMETQINQISEFNVTSNNNNNNNINISDSNDNIENNNLINNNNWERDQVVQLMKLENKIRKIEAGISEISEFKSPQSSSTPISTTTITTTTTTHHTYTNDNIDQPETISSPLFTTNQPQIDENDVVSATTPIQNVIDNNSSNLTDGNDEETLNSPNTPYSSNTPITNSTNSNIKSLIFDSILLGGGSILSNVFYQLMYNKGSSAESLSTSTIIKSSLKFGLIITSLGAIIKFSSLLNSKKQNQTNIAPVDYQTKSNYKDILISGMINASIFGGILYLKNRKPIDSLYGGLLGFANGLIIKYK